jgi:hypothetical protein
MELRAMRTGDLPGAVAVWHAANIARRGKPPTPQRVARIIEKLQEPDALPYVAAEGDAIVGMALAESRAAKMMGLVPSFLTHFTFR